MTENEYRDKVYKQAAEVRTREDFDKLFEEIAAYGHDYGSIVYGCMAVMKGAFNALNRSPNGGITGFQAGCLGWECIKEFMSISGPARILEYDNLLYPQYANKFEKRIDPETWAKIQKKAKHNLLDQKSAHPGVVEHWKEIARGKVPFGFEVKAD